MSSLTSGNQMHFPSSYTASLVSFVISELFVEVNPIQGTVGGGGGVGTLFPSGKLSITSQERLEL